MENKYLAVITVLIIGGVLFWISVAPHPTQVLAEVQQSKNSFVALRETGTVDTIEAVNPDFSMSYKVVTGGPTVHPGDLLTYTIVYTNSGDEDALNVVISDTLADDLIYVTGGTYTGAEVVFALSSVPINTGGKVSFVAQVDDEVPAGIVLTNTATILSSQTAPWETDPVTTLVEAPQLWLTKSVTPEGVWAPGTLLTYTLVCGNSGNQTANSVVITDALPAGLMYLDSDGTWDGEIVRWTLGTLGITDSHTVYFTAMITDGAGSIHNVAYVGSHQRKSQKSNTVTTGVDAAVLSVRKEANPQEEVKQSTPLVYTLYYTNTGLYPITGGLLVDKLPAGTVYIRGGTHYTLDNSVVFSLPETIQPGYSGVVSLTVSVTAMPGTQLHNAANVFYDQLYPATFSSTASLVISGTQAYGPLGGNSNRRYIAQAFTATAPRLKRAGILVQGYTLPYPEITVHLFGNTNGHPDLTQELAKGSLTTITAEGQRYFVDPLYPVRLELGEKYWVVLELQTGVDLGSARVQLALEDVYPDGSWVYSEDNGASWVDAPSPNTDLDILVEYMPPPKSNTVSHTVLEPPKCLSVEPLKLRFFKVVAEAGPMTQTLSIDNCAPGIVSWEAFSNQAWLTLSPHSGTAPSLVNAIVNADGLPIGFYTDIITVDASGAQNSPRYISVELKVSTGDIFIPLILRDWPLTPPQELHVTDSSFCFQAYTLAWDVTNQYAYYVLEEARSEEFTDVVVYTPTTASHNIAGQTLGDYYYRVKGCSNSEICSGYSDVLSVHSRLEEEPNDIRPDQARGPIRPGYTYCGNFSKADDIDDHFYFDLSAAHRVELTLSNIQIGSDYNLLIYDADDNIKGYSAESGTSDEYILTELLPPGRYYVRIYNYGGSVEIDQYYHLGFDLH